MPSQNLQLEKHCSSGILALVLLLSTLTAVLHQLKSITFIFVYIPEGPELHVYLIDNLKKAFRKRKSPLRVPNRILQSRNPVPEL